MKILVVDDDIGLAQMIKNALSSDGYVVETANDGAEGSFLARSYGYDVIILDYSLPKKDGIQVCLDIRKSGKSTPIIFLSVTMEVSLKVEALGSGADDYMTKPFSMEELRARVKAISRRPTKIQKPIISLFDLSLDTEKQTIHRGRKLIKLTRKEFNLLHYLMINIGVVMSRAMIMEHVWTADSDLLSNTVETHMGNLRRKINGKGRPDLIFNIPGRGYIMDTPENLKKFTS